MASDRDAAYDADVGALLALVRGYVGTQSLYAAALLGVADSLAGGPRAVAELAAETGCDVSALERLLRALASVDVVEQPTPGNFALGRLGHLLRSDVDGSMRSWVLLNGGTLYRAFAEIPFTLRTGRPATQALFGQDLFDHLRQSPDEAAIFEAAMAGFSRYAAPGTVAAVDFGSSRHVVDVGGGTGELLAAVLRAHPFLRGTLLDRENVLVHARTRFAGTDEGARCELVAGDFFRCVPEGGDTYLLSWILHDWDDEPAAAILRNIRRAMADDGRVLVIESVLPPGDEPHFSRFGDIVMLVALGGRERTEAEYGALFRSAGLRLHRITPAGGPRSILEAVPC